MLVVVGGPVRGWHWVEPGNGSTTESEAGVGAPRTRAMSVREDGDEVGQDQLPKCCQANHTKGRTWKALVRLSLQKIIKRYILCYESNHSNLSHQNA